MQAAQLPEGPYQPIVRSHGQGGADLAGLLALGGRICPETPLALQLDRLVVGDPGQHHGAIGLEQCIIIDGWFQLLYDRAILPQDLQPLALQGVEIIH